MSIIDDLLSQPVTKQELSEIVLELTATLEVLVKYLEFKGLLTKEEYEKFYVANVPAVRSALDQVSKESQDAAVEKWKVANPEKVKLLENLKLFLGGKNES